MASSYDVFYYLQQKLKLPCVNVGKKPVFITLGFAAGELDNLMKARDKGKPKNTMRRKIVSSFTEERVQGEERANDYSRIE